MAPCDPSAQRQTRRTLKRKMLTRFGPGKALHATYDYCARRVAHSLLANLDSEHCEG
jgi:hypothetical protein